MSEELLSEPAGSVHRLILNRPARRNALTPDLARALANEVERLGEESGAHAIVLAGTGGHFCVGLDLHWLSSLGPEPPIAALQRGLSDFQSAVLAIVRCPLPVVAVLEGSVAGFGVDLALACDLRLATETTRITSAFARMGLVPDGGSTFTLPRLVGTGRALRLLLGGPTLDATAALNQGLVDEVHREAELAAAVERLVDGIGGGSRASLRAIKRLVRAPEVGALEQALSAEGAAQLQALQGEEFRRRLAAFASRPQGAERPV